MTATLIYALIALLIIVLAAFLTRRRHNEGTASGQAGKDYLPSLWDGPSLTLAERIFDSTDYIWLREEIGQPHLAQMLTRSRKRLALRWLRALERSFEELVCVPNPLPPHDNPDPAFSTWQLLWLTLRIRCLLSYAYLTVWIFGPYHRLVPPLDWVPSLLRSDARKARYPTTDTGPFL
jgi:hypothetical protein